MYDEGLVVAELWEDGLAAKAGLKNGDRIIKLNDKTVADLEHSAIKATLTDSESVDFSIMRDDEAMDVSVHPSKE